MLLFGFDPIALKVVEMAEKVVYTIRGVKKGFAQKPRWKRMERNNGITEAVA